jgi:hypothetical protein
MKPEDIHRLFEKYRTEQDLEGLGPYILQMRCLYQVLEEIPLLVERI